MKYLIGIVFFFISLGLLLAVGKTAYLGFTESWTWFLVMLPLLATNVVSVLITSLGLSIPYKES